MSTLGQHFILDGIPGEGLPSVEALREALLILPARLGLTVVGPPQVAVQGGAPVGLVLLSESHLAIHFGAVGPTVHADLFSCRSFSEQEAEAWLVAHFHLIEVRTRTIPR
ncbi:MAG: S-adenosylmethionine decarboxylase [Deltaproteobacteria bacterium]|nr:S-adenosylmethionine decarboxylase [Deltaproteobacteria bacterium]